MYIYILDTYIYIIILYIYDALLLANHIYRESFKEISHSLYFSQGSLLCCLQNGFLKYFVDWLASIEQHPGSFLNYVCCNMCISWETFAALKITFPSS